LKGHNQTYNTGIRNKAGLEFARLFYAPLKKINGKNKSFLDYGMHGKRDNTENRKFRSFETAK
jgi:hypothetical protein